jgi:hypothetical protein
MAATWLLCSYRLPREPTRLRLAVWRRLKRIGAITLHDGLWILPHTPQAQEDLEWLGEEIEERKGSVQLFEAESLPGGQDGQIVAQFRSQSELGYASLTAAANRLTTARKRSPRSTLKSITELQRELGREKRRDYFKVPEGRLAEAAIREAAAAVSARLATKKSPRRSHALGHSAKVPH